MRTAILAAVLLLQLPVFAEVSPEKIGVETMSDPNGHWFLVRSQGGYVFDGETGEMLGMLPLTENTPAVAVNHDRGEAYAAESHWSRTYRGDREDVMTIYDTRTMYPVAEVDIPDKTAALRVAEHIGVSGNGEFVFMYNMTPAQSVSVVNVASRTFAGEVSTPGCGMIMPVEDRSFLSVCGDGTVQLIVLDEQGKETDRVRSGSFFSVQDDAVFDRTTRTRDGWLLISHHGQAFNVSVSGSRISVSDAWSLVTDEEKEKGWRPGGGGLITSHLPTNLSFVLMHKGGEDTHHDAGTEIWIFDPAKQKRVLRWELEEPAVSIFVMQHEQSPRLVMYTEEGKLHLFSALTQRYERSIDEFGASAWSIQGF